RRRPPPPRGTGRARRRIARCACLRAGIGPHPARPPSTGGHMPTATRQPTRTSELIAHEALALRTTLIRAYRSSASREDLEDLYSQAVIELLARAERDPTLTSPDHIRHALRHRFVSGILDPHRAVAGRSPATHARARTRPLDDTLDQHAGDRDGLDQLI